jgi:hypothetical protein
MREVTFKAKISIPDDATNEQIVQYLLENLSGVKQKGNSPLDGITFSAQVEEWHIPPVIQEDDVIVEIENLVSVSGKEFLTYKVNEKELSDALKNNDGDEDEALEFLLDNKKMQFISRFLDEDGVNQSTQSCVEFSVPIDDLL